MFSLIDLPPVKFINLYTKPINMQWGANKLKNICLNELNIDPKDGGVFLFFNRAMDKLKLFFIDDTGPQEITKILLKGGFMLPISKNNDVLVKIEKSKLETIFKR